MLDKNPSPRAESEESYPYTPRPATLSLQQDQGPSEALSSVAAEWSWLLQLGPATALYGCLLACDFAIVPLMSVFSERDWGALWVYASAGGILAQGGLSSILAVFLRASFWLRMGAFCAAVLLAWIFWALGIAFNVFALQRSSAYYIYDELRLVAFGLPLVALAIQMPLWGLRLYRGWELLRPEQQGQPALPLKILDYLVCTGVVAVAITSARLADEPAEINGDYWAGFSIACAAAAGISLVSVPPALLLSFRWRKAWLGWIALIAYGVIAAAVTLGIIECVTLMSWQRSSGIRLWSAIGIATLFASFGAFLGAGLLLLRATGFFLVTRRHQQRLKLNAH